MCNLKISHLQGDFNVFTTGTQHRKIETKVDFPEFQMTVQMFNF